MARFAHTHTPFVTYGAPYDMMNVALGEKSIESAFSRCYHAHVRLRSID
jgi:hypothetical protein